MNRRNFVQQIGASGALGIGRQAWAQGGGSRQAAIVIDPADPVASAPPALWAAQELASALTGAGFTVLRLEHPSQAKQAERTIQASGSAAPVAKAALRAAAASMPADPESLALLPAGTPRSPALVAAGPTARGLVYALLELADRVRGAPQPDAALQIARPVVEAPANKVRGIMRQFTSELLDKPWFNDREMWPRYLTMLATQRINRFHLAFGLGYDTLDQVADSYFLFLYPFLLSVPGYNVRATNLPGAERDSNLAMLQYIGEQSVARGIEFELGIWTHGYRWTNSPRARYNIEGITPENHALYSRDALTALLKACPAISSVCLRIHGESGVAEGSYDFWRTVFSGAAGCGRTVELDLHAKGIDAPMIEAALSTGLPLNLAPKFSAEHMGMPYHQAAIRDLEMPVAGRTGRGLMTLSEGSRSFTRYGYADLLREDRKYTVRHRMFSGTQRLLLWGDPQFAAAYSRSFSFCGSTGADLMEPLTCRGRRGSAEPGARSGYADARLESHWDWQKYEYWYRVWGRAMYNPGSAAQAWQRQFGSSSQAAALERALASASRILPVVTTAHLPSAACDAYWPEIYWNQPMAAEPHPNPYSDSPAPRTFQNVSPLDPQLFSRISDFAAGLLRGESDGKYSPLEVAQWLDDLAAEAEAGLTAAGKIESVELSRVAIDVGIQVGLGRFFAAKLRAGALYSIHAQKAHRPALEESVKAYKRARARWAEVVEQAKGVYAADLSVSDRFSERGQWRDRLAGMDQDIALLEAPLSPDSLMFDEQSSNPRADLAVQQSLARPHREAVPCRHRPPASFRPNADVELAVTPGNGAKVIAVKLYYRHVNQAETWQSAGMTARNGEFRAAIPGAYTASPYALQYYFQLLRGREEALLYPGFTPQLTNQPYFVLRPA